jgi:hypothetical protein
MASVRWQLSNTQGCKWIPRKQRQILHYVKSENDFCFQFQNFRGGRDSAASDNVL